MFMFRRMWWKSGYGAGGRLWKTLLLAMAGGGLDSGAIPSPFPFAAGVGGWDFKLSLSGGATGICCWAEGACGAGAGIGPAGKVGGLCDAGFVDGIPPRVTVLWKNNRHINYTSMCYRILPLVVLEGFPFIVQQKLITITGNQSINQGSGPKYDLTANQSINQSINRTES